MLGIPDGTVRDRTVGLAERGNGDARKFRPERIRFFDIETFMQIKADSQSGFVDVEESPEPSAEEEDHPWVCISEDDFSIPLAAFRGVQS
jgi:hypothetical protein